MTLGTVLAEANRVAVRKGRAGAGAFAGMKPGPVDWYSFNTGDNTTREWYPQGLSSASDAGGGGDAFVVSWYHKPSSGAERGVRLTFLDPATLRYRHVLLVRALPGGDIAPVNIHAGGVAWYGDLLYVADTTRGLRVFDTRQIFEVNGDDDDAIGRKGGSYHAFGYRYVMPQTDAWTTAGGGSARFSFVAVDRSTERHTLISGEYVDEPGAVGRVARWPLTAGGGLDAGGGTARAVDAYRLPVDRVQGALSHRGTWYLSQTGGSTRNGALVVVGDTTRRRPYPVGPEDLTCVRDSGTLWSVTEFVGRRAIYAVPL
ncbi:hypothetical protein FHS43_002731 [Streptosporangium becharense]|uniref:Secreted protein n=1 Tax=Streptosporangium becharense TaxID=1816182 RepID=A0A7W9IL27_9ACTN|nr:hypothetical protein [Streptosporangium becharense]MBB2911458.1 hypothetical protein [Streptosporangium becharense]MBB5822724.1 hypothetical protein [Streptosporangium becharense]